MSKNERKSYVYVYIRTDNNTIFYVGKGTGNRYKDKKNKRNDHFKNIVNKVPHKVVKIKENLTSELALVYEICIIFFLVFKKGYGIDIEGYKKPGNIEHLCNATWGGEGTNGYTHTEEWKLEKSKRMRGKNPRDFMTEEAKIKHDSKLSNETHPNAKVVILLNTKEIFKTMKEAGKKYNVCASSISDCCRGKCKSAGRHPITYEKLVFMYYKDYLKNTK